MIVLEILSKYNNDCIVSPIRNESSEYIAIDGVHYSDIFDKNDLSILSENDCHWSSNLSLWKFNEERV